MSVGRSDFELLRAFARQGDQQAFAAVTRRHLDLVYATARRKVTDDGAAEEICQNVFGVLARKAWQFAPDDSLPSWLHRTTLLEAKSWLRGELRRRRREQAAAELGTTMKTPDEQPAFNALVPLLDEALLSLRDQDRTALLLRYHESRSLRDVGESLGTSEDAARKRVAAALEKLAHFYQRRGYKTATVAAAAAALQHTAASTPAVTASSVTKAALRTAAPTFAGMLALLALFMSLTRVQKVAATLTVTAALAIWAWNEKPKAEAAASPGQSDAAQTADVKRQAKSKNPRENFFQFDDATQSARQNTESAQPQRYVEITAEIETITYQPGDTIDAESGRHRTFSVVCIVGKNAWRIDNNFLIGGEEKWFFDGTNTYDSLRVTEPMPKDEGRIMRYVAPFENGFTELQYFSRFQAAISGCQTLIRSKLLLDDDPDYAADYHEYSCQGSNSTLLIRYRDNLTFTNATRLNLGVTEAINFKKPQRAWNQGTVFARPDPLPPYGFEALTAVWLAYGSRCHYGQSGKGSVSPVVFVGDEFRESGFKVRANWVVESKPPGFLGFMAEFGMVLE